jgi:hypothetical protein
MTNQAVISTSYECFYEQKNVAPSGEIATIALDRSTLHRQREPLADQHPKIL